MDSRPSDVSILSDDKAFYKKEQEEESLLPVENDKEEPLLERYLRGHR